VFWLIVLSQLLLGTTSDGNIPSSSARMFWKALDVLWLSVMIDLNAGLFLSLVVLLQRAMSELEHSSLTALRLTTRWESHREKFEHAIHHQLIVLQCVVCPAVCKAATVMPILAWFTHRNSVDWTHTCSLLTKEVCLENLKCRR